MLPARTTSESRSDFRAKHVLWKWLEGFPLEVAHGNDSDTDTIELKTWGLVEE